MFSLDHFVWMGIVLVIVLVLTFFSSKYKWSYKTATRIIFIIYIAAEIFKICTHMYPISKWLGEGANVDGWENAMYELPKSLPFQLCSSMIFFIAYLVFGKNEKRIATIRSFVAPVLLIGGSLAVILGTCLNSSNTANFGDSFKDPECGPVQFFLYHGGMLWYAIYLLKNKQVKFGLKQFFTNILILGAMVVLAIWINSVLLTYGTNYMFVVYPPAKGIPLLNFNHGWHVYMVHYILLMFIAMFLYELPGIIKETKAKKGLDDGIQKI